MISDTLCRIESAQETSEPKAPRRPGRPSVQDRRKQQIVGAFIDLVAEKGLEGVSLDDIAVRAGVQRTALRHFVGNRSDLIAAAVEQVGRSAAADLGEPTTFTQLAARLFGPGRIANLTAVDDAWNALLPEALRMPEGRALIKASWDHLIEVIEAALRYEYPAATRASTRDTAYAIACLAEQDFVFQRVGYPRARSKGAMDAALALAEQLG